MTKLGIQLKGQLVGRDMNVPAGQRANAPGPAADTGTIAPSSSLTGLVRNRLAGKLAGSPGIRFGDGSYYLPRHEEVQAILETSQLNRRTWMEERFDCDDFAYVLKAEMSVQAYEANGLRFGLCVGMVWGNFSWVEGYHAVNWYVDSNNGLYFIEPQTDEIYGVEDCQGEITLLLV